METYYGHVRSPADAIILFEACRIGLLPRVQRRLSEKERQMIRSGSVFVWDEREAGMRRWTDGKSWSASRVSGSFLTYREMEGKRGGTTVSQPSMAARAGKTPESTRGSDDDRGDGPDDGPDGYRYKPDGLMKQSFSITTSTGQHLHLISYFSRSHPSAASLQQPSTDPNLRNVRPQKGLYPESTVNDQQNLPVVTRGPMAGAAYSIPPHPMAAYGRSAPPHPQSYPAGPSYAAPTWPPTPLHTPPTVSLHYSYPPPSNGHVAYGQPPPPPHALPPPPQAPGYPAHYERAVHPSEAAALPPTLHHSAAPIPHHSPLHVLAGRSPQLVEAHEPYERSSPREYGHGPPPPPPRMSPRTHAQHPLLSHTNGLTTAAPPARSPPLLSQPSIPPPPSLPKLGDSGSNASGVPSIGALMNGAPSGGGGLPSISAPPLTTAGRLDGPRDIPNEKIGIGGEDVRALRQLDRAAFTV